MAILKKLDLDTPLLRRVLEQYYGISCSNFLKLHGFYDLNLQVTAPKGEKYFIKIFGYDTLPSIKMQIEFAGICRRSGLPVAAVIRARNGRKYFIYKNTYGIVQEFLQGIEVRKFGMRSGMLVKLGQMLARMHLATLGKKFRERTSKRYVWDLGQFHLTANKLFSVKRYFTPAQYKVMQKLCEEWKLNKSNLQKLPAGVVHNDFHSANVLASMGAITGITDFGDALYSWYAGDVATSLITLCFRPSPKIGLRKIVHFLKGYTSVRTLSADEKKWLLFLMQMRLVILAVNIPAHFKNKPKAWYKDFLKEDLAVLEFFNISKNARAFEQMLHSPR